MNIEVVPFVIQLLSTMQMSVDVPCLASLTVISYAICKSQQMCKGPANMCTNISVRLGQMWQSQESIISCQ